MADDEAILKLLVAVDTAGAEAVVVGDYLQLGAVEPGGGLEALIRRHSDAVVILDENIRQRNPGERVALEHLRSGDVGRAVDWYQANGRIVTAATRTEVLDVAVDAWEADLLAGQESVLLAWRRRDVAALNERARQRCIAAGAIRGPEVEAPGGRRYAAGDRIVTLSPSADGRLVTSERGRVKVVHSGGLTVRFDDGRTELLAREELGPDRLDHAYAVTVHRMQGATVDSAHVIADGCSRELAYVAMSRARATCQIYKVADDLGQACADLATEWSLSRRPRWTIDVNVIVPVGTKARPILAQRTKHAVFLAQLMAERDAIAEVAPDATDRLHAVDARIRLNTIEKEAGTAERGLSLA